MRKFLIQNARNEYLVDETVFFAPTAEDIYMVYQGICGQSIYDIFVYFQKRIAALSPEDLKPRAAEWPNLEPEF